MRLQAIAIVAANILLGSACQSSNSPSTSNSTTGPTIVYAVSHLAVTMDPCFIPGGNETSEVNNWLYLAWDYNPVTTANGPIPMDDVTSAFKGNMVPGLLTSWELSSDQLTWTLHIRKGVVDSYGNEVKAKFAKWVLERVNKAGGCSYWTNALGVPDAASQVTVVDDYTLRVQLKTPNAIFLNVLNSNSGLVMGPEVMKHVTTADPWGTQWLRQNAPATGPYLLKSWTPGVEQVFVRNPKYIGPNPAQIGKIIYRLVPDASVRVTLLLSGQAQVARDLSPQNIKQISDSKKAVAHCVAGNRYVYAAFNVTPGHPTENLLLRQALNYAVPYDDVINSVYNGTATRLYGFAPPITNGYLGQSAFPYRYDLTKASNVLAQSGLHNVRLTLLINNTFPEHQQIAVLLQNSFSKIGVSLTIDKKPAAAWYDQAASRSGFDLALNQNGPIIVDPQYIANLQFGPGPPPNENFGGYGNSAFFNAETTVLGVGPARTAANDFLQKSVIDDAAWLFIAVAPTCFSFTPNMKGYIWHTVNQVQINEMHVQ